MATGKITKRTVEDIKPKARPVFLWDEETRGFGAKVTPAGNRIYVLQYRMSGRGSPTKRLKIGNHGSITADQARQEAKALLLQKSQGVDPLEARKERARQDADLGFPEVAASFLAECRTHWERTTFDREEGNLRLHCIPHLKKALPRITREDLGIVLSKIPPDKLPTRRRVFSTLSNLFSWAVETGLIKRSVMQGMKGPPTPAARDRVLLEDELREIWNACEEMGYPFGPLYRLLILTGQRRDEVAGLLWNELSRNGQLWSLPATRTKNDEATAIHLSQLVIDQLDRIADGPDWPSHGLVFTTTGTTAVSGFSRAKKRIDKVLDWNFESEAQTPWRIHDFRRTLATGLQKLGVRFEVTEAVLNHVSGSRSGVAGIYQQYRWTDEKRGALDAWALRVKCIVDGEDQTSLQLNVIPLAKEQVWIGGRLG